MTKSVFVLAVLAAAVSTSAVAKDLKQNKQAPAVSATQMTDSREDKRCAREDQPPMKPSALRIESIPGSPRAAI